MDQEAIYILSTARLGLRRWAPSDLEPFCQMNQDPEVMRYFPRLYTPEESAGMIKRIDAFFDETGYGLYALELRSTGEFIGYTGFSRPSFEHWFTPCTEIGWRLKQDAWGRGYATEAALACMDHGFRTLELNEVYSFTAVLNTRSEKVMQKIAMIRLGEFDHPKVEAGHPLQRHVLYRKTL
jgi:RimJ/RimL family protein N-acetyltransferase